jgi:diguanylate cyclase (GGDEF)-like protein
VKVLIAEDDPVSSLVLKKTLTKWGHTVVATTNGAEAWQELQEEDAPRVAILDWLMPGMGGPELCRKIRKEPNTSASYIILLTALNRKENLLEGLEAGADDYITKPFDSHELRVRLQAGMRIVELQSSLTKRVQELETAIGERKKAEEALRQLTLTDELTGLYNYRGFSTLAAHQLKSNRRAKESSVLIYADMDGLKQINDTFGHAEGSLAIVNVAQLLRQTFRESDIVGRLGGDEFAILAQEITPNALDTMLRRLRENLRVYNIEQNHSYPLSLSIGATHIEPQVRLGIEELIARADEAMYEQKRSRKHDDVSENIHSSSLLNSDRNPRIAARDAVKQTRVRFVPNHSSGPRETPRKRIDQVTLVT